MVLKLQNTRVISILCRFLLKVLLFLVFSIKFMCFTYVNNPISWELKGEYYSLYLECACFHEKYAILGLQKSFAMKPFGIDRLLSYLMKLIQGKHFFFAKKWSSTIAAQINSSTCVRCFGAVFDFLFKKKEPIDVSASFARKWIDFSLFAATAGKLQVPKLS